MNSRSERVARRIGLTVGILIACSILIGAWRPLIAWWADDAGNHALFQDHRAAALRWFATGLRYEPTWGMLHEDRGRVLMASDPAAALAEFQRAACGAPCTAEEGDALVRLGKPEAAIDRYIAAKAVSRLADRALELAVQGKYATAIALEHTVIRHLRNDFLERADLASSYATLGSIESMAAAASATSVARPHQRESVQAFQKASDLAPLNEGYLLSYAFAELQWGDGGAARRAFERLLRLHPHQSDAEAALMQLEKASPASTTSP